MWLFIRKIRERNHFTETISDELHDETSWRDHTSFTKRIGTFIFAASETIEQ